MYVKNVSHLTVILNIITFKTYLNLITCRLSQCPVETRYLSPAHLNYPLLCPTILSSLKFSRYGMNEKWMKIRWLIENEEFSFNWISNSLCTLKLTIHYIVDKSRKRMVRNLPTLEMFMFYIYELLVLEICKRCCFVKILIPSIFKNILNFSSVFVRQ